MCGICCVCSLASGDQQCPYLNMGYIKSHSSIPRRGPDVNQSINRQLGSRGQALFAGFVLHLRGSVTPQPLTNDDGDILLWNGEIFGGIQVKEEENDTEVLFSHLVRCDSPANIAAVFRTIQGPWSFIYWQAKRERLWFGRDVFGRRSLLWHLPQGNDDVFALSSVPVTPLEFAEVPSVGLFCMELSSDHEGKDSPSNTSSPPLLHLHLYPWQRATWPGTEEEVMLDDSLTVTQRLHLDVSSVITVSTHNLHAVDSWMPVLNSDFPHDCSLSAENSEAGDMHQDATARQTSFTKSISLRDECNGTDGLSNLVERDNNHGVALGQKGSAVPFPLQDMDNDLASVLKEIDRRGQWTRLVSQFEEVLQKAVRKRVHNLPRPLHKHCHHDCHKCLQAFLSDQSDVEHVCESLSMLGAGSECQSTFNGIVHSSKFQVYEGGNPKSCSLNLVTDPALINRAVTAKNDHAVIKRTVTESAATINNDHAETGNTATAEINQFGTGNTVTSVTDHSKTECSVNHGTDQLVDKMQVLVPAQQKTDSPQPVADKHKPPCRQTCGSAGEGERKEDSSGGQVRAYDSTRPAHVAVLFSGGVDSTVLAALADRCVPEEEAIDLINVAFEQKFATQQADRKNKRNQAATVTETSSSYDVPDRRTGYLALSELNPRRCWNFVEVNVTQEMLQKERASHVRHLVYPLNTVLDDSIGCAVWFAARGKGVLGSGPRRGQPYISTARVILCGMGADEQLAGYSRHRVRFQQESWSGLIAEINMEIHRISARNLGRDDRVITDHGKESRFPFLDEDVVTFLASLPIHHKADLRLPRGVGEKLLLRLLALRLNLSSTSALPKRAIQFGSRIAKLERSKEKGNQVCDRLTQQ